MKANELRIGNFIKIPFLGDVELTIFGLAVTETSEDVFIQTKSKSGGTFFEKVDKYEPIELTEEWFFKLGFVKIDRKGPYGDIYAISDFDSDLCI